MKKSSQTATQDSMSKSLFEFDRMEWEALSGEEQEYWLDWAESCGADRQVQLIDRNPHYPDMVCLPVVSLGLSDEELDKIFEICEEPPKMSDHVKEYLENNRL